MKKATEIEISVVQKRWREFVEGNNECLKEVFICYRSSLFFTAFYYLKNESDSNDIVNDIFLKLLEMSTKERFELLSGVEEKLETFLKVMVKNKCLDKIKVDNNRRDIIIGIKHLFNRSNIGKGMIEDDFKGLLELLPMQQRRIFELHMNGYDNQSISDELEISYNTVRNTLSTSKQKLRQIWVKFMS